MALPGAPTRGEEFKTIALRERGNGAEEDHEGCLVVFPRISGTEWVDSLLSPMNATMSQLRALRTLRRREIVLRTERAKVARWLTEREENGGCSISFWPRPEVERQVRKDSVMRQTCKGVLGRLDRG